MSDSLSNLNLDIDSSHPWFESTARAAIAAHERGGICEPTAFLASIRIGGVEEFYMLDSIYEITTFDNRVQTYRTAWRKVYRRAHA
jgi:hypothetical protein